MVKIVVDSSVLIQNLREGREMFFGIVDGSVRKEIEMFIPSVVIMEIWSGKSMDKKSFRKMIEDRIRPFKKIGVDEKLAMMAGEIRGETGMSGVDAIIAACCLEYKAKLATLNKKHFGQVKGLRFF